MSDQSEKKSLSLNFETVGSIVAMIVGMTALFVAWDQSQIMRKEQHANVLPIITVLAGFSTNSAQHTMLIEIENNGVGPALIQTAELSVGQLKVDSWPTMSNDLLPEPLRSGYSTSFGTAVGALSDGQRKVLARVTWPRSEENDEAFQVLQSAVLGSDQAGDLSVCYCSVFDRCWIVNRESQNRPQRVEVCQNQGYDFSANLMATLNQVDE